jgi:phosphatidylserine/phosphatidylglycerophosphate/cardiolipin synthase-like enzyme
MAKFLTTSGITYHLEGLVKGAKEKLILISPFLKVNERLRQILDDKDREKIDIRVVYGKNELQPEENNWLKSKASIRSSFCKNLHAKCFLNESEALITSMNLYEFSQVNNEEMGILVAKAENPPLYASVYEEAMRLIRISDEVRVTVEKITPAEVHFEPAGKRTGRKQTLPGRCES